MYVIYIWKWSSARCQGRQWCGIIHYYWWTASIKLQLLFSRAGYASWGLSLSSFYYYCELYWHLRCFLRRMCNFRAVRRQNQNSPTTKSRVWNISCYHLDLSLNISSIDINDNSEVRHASPITVVYVEKWKPHQYYVNTLPDKVSAVPSESHSAYFFSFQITERLSLSQFLPTCHDLESVFCDLSKSNVHYLICALSVIWKTSLRFIKFMAFPLQTCSCR